METAFESDSAVRDSSTAERQRPADGFVPSHGRGWLRPWSAQNPGNRLGPAGTLAARIRRETWGGRELYRILLGIVRDPKITTKHRLTAIGMLLDRGWGKAVATLLTADISQHDRPTASALDVLTAEELTQLVTTLTKLSDMSQPVSQPVIMPSQTVATAGEEITEVTASREGADAPFRVTEAPPIPAPPLKS